MAAYTCTFGARFGEGGELKIFHASGALRVALTSAAQEE